MRSLPVTLMAALAVTSISFTAPAEASGFKLPSLKIPDPTKELTKGMKLPKSKELDTITEYSEYALKPPKKNEEYVKVGEDILKIDKRNNKVLEVMGTAEDLKK